MNNLNFPHDPNRPSPVETRDQAIAAGLQLKIDPDNQFARRGVAALQARGVGPAPPSSETGEE
jgi:hypothetical protein